MPLVHLAPAPGGSNHTVAESARPRFPACSRVPMIEPQGSIGVPGRIHWNSREIPPPIVRLLCAGEGNRGMIQVKRRAGRVAPQFQPATSLHRTGNRKRRVVGKVKVKPAGKPGSVTGIAPYDGHSSRRRVAPALQPPTRGLERATHCTPSLRVQHPPIWCCSGWRLPRFTPWGARRADKSARRSQGLVSVALFLVFAEGKPSTSTYGR